MELLSCFHFYCTNKSALFRAAIYLAPLDYWNHLMTLKMSSLLDLSSVFQTDGDLCLTNCLVSQLMLPCGPKFIMFPFKQQDRYIYR